MSCRYSNAKYMTIAEVIARRLRAGDFQNKEQFYSRDELARAYHISPGTARAVLRVLEDRGGIACRKGKRPVPAGIFAGIHDPLVCHPVFVRDSCTAETPEYDYLLYCARNILLRQKTGLDEHDPDLPEYGIPPNHSPGYVPIVFPSAATTAETPDPTTLRPAGGYIALLINHAGNNAVSLFTRKADLDCTLHLMRHNISTIIHVASGHSAFPWFRRISTPGVLDEYIPGCRTSSIVYNGEFELFPVFLAETIPATAGSDHAPVAVLIDDPYLSDYLSGEIRVGAYRPPSRCSFFGTAFNERSMIFPYLDLKLDALAASVIQAAYSKAENPPADLPCVFSPDSVQESGACMRKSNPGEAD